MRKTVLFDLDGTIIDSGEGVTRCVQHALTSFGYGEQPREALNRFIGPPLHISFEEFYNMTPEEAQKAVAVYRERYREKGVFENELYDGVPELLKALYEREITLVLATSKPLVFAEQILGYLGLKQYFSHIIGSNLDNTMTDKAEVVACALRKTGVSDKSAAIMVGDRKFDIIGAKANGIASVGVLYGYGSKEEFEEAGADFIIEKPMDLLEICE